MHTFWKQNNIFIAHIAVFIIVLGLLLCSMDKGALHLALNGFHSTAGDIFFKYYTSIGEWAAYLIIAALLVFYKAGAATYVLTSNLLAGLITQIIKHIVAAPRPITFFNIANNPDILPLVEGVEMRAYNSFPSGHTATFVAVFFTLSILVGKSQLSAPTQNLLQYFCFVLAILGAYSRIYLSQHFAADIFAGTIIAVIVTVALYPIFMRWEKLHQISYNWKLQYIKL